MSEQVAIIEVSPRDGLQNEAVIATTAEKIELVASLVAAGARRIEATSFAHPRLVPQMADAEAVMAGVPRVRGVSYSGLALNERGAQRAIDAGVDEINYVIPLTDLFATANQNTTVAGALDTLEVVGRHAAAAAIPLTVTFAVAFGCPFAGDVSADTVVGGVRDALARADVAEVALADTIGCGVPWQVEEVFSRVAELTDLPLRGHFHETRHTAIANVVAALSAGARRFDSSVAGLGGCPFAPGAAGNVATEDLAWALGRGGYDHGFDIDRATAAGRAIAAAVGIAPRSGIASAGPFPPATLAEVVPQRR